MLWFYAFLGLIGAWMILAITWLVLSFRYRRGLFALRCRCGDL